MTSTKKKIWIGGSAAAALALTAGGLAIGLPAADAATPSSHAPTAAHASHDQETADDAGKSDGETADDQGTGYHGADGETNDDAPSAPGK